MKQRRLLICMALASLAVPAFAANGGDAANAGLDSLSETSLYSELADRGLDDLLKRAMDADRLSPDQQNAISTLSTLRRLRAANLPDEQRQILLNSVVSNLDKILSVLRSNPDALIKEAKVIAEQGVDPNTGLLEYWGDSQADRAHLQPLAQAALKMYDLAAQISSAQATDFANKITKPDDPIADQWRKASDTASAANYQRARMQYALALSLDLSDSHRGDLIAAALKTLDTWDGSDSGIQPQVRLLMAKLHVLYGDRDEIRIARNLLNSIIKNPDGEISPAPTPELIFEAKCYGIIAGLAINDFATAQIALHDATDFQQSKFANDQDQAAALRLLNYRLLALKADQSPAGPAKDSANDAAVSALGQLIKDFPNLRGAIFRQLAARLPANPDLANLDPMLLLAMVDEGRQTLVNASVTHPIDKPRLHAGIDAAQEIMHRAQSGAFPRADPADACFLLGIFQENLGDKATAANSLLNYIEQYSKDPKSHADVALEHARGIIADLRQTTTVDPQVPALEDRFLPIAINPPFNRREFALQYAANLFQHEKWKEAIPYYQMVGGKETPQRQLIARYGEMVALKNLMEESPNLSPDDRVSDTSRIQKLVDNVTALANQILQSPAPEADKARAKSTLARMSLIAADITRREENDPKRVLKLLNGFEDSVKGLPDSKSLISGALFLRVQAYMQLGENDDATKTLVQYLNSSSANEGAQTVHDLLATLNKNLDQARAEADAATDRGDQTAASAAQQSIRQLAGNRAMLSGFLVKWADENPDPKIHAYAYIYRRFDADTKRVAAELATDPAQRAKSLAAALDLYKQLQSPENVALYQAGLDPQSGIDKTQPDPLVSLGIGLIAYDLGDCRTVKDTLGPLVQNEKLGENNDQMWEATYKLLDCMRTLSKSGDPNTPIAQVQQSLKVLYLIWRDQTGGKKYHEKFEALRKEVLPTWKVPTSETPKP